MLPDGHLVEREPTLVKLMTAKVFFLLVLQNPLFSPRNCLVVYFSFRPYSCLFFFSPVSHTPSVLNLLQLIIILFLPSYVVTSEDVICLQGVEQKAEEISRLKEVNLTFQ